MQVGNGTLSLRDVVETPHERLMWGQPHTVHPRLCSTVFGDGAMLLGVEPTNTRPEYYVVRIDSEWNGKDLDDEPFRDFLDDDVIEALFDEFGNADDGPEDGGELGETADWPAVDLSCGHAWFVIKDVRASDWPPAPSKSGDGRTSSVSPVVQALANAWAEDPEAMPDESREALLDWAREFARQTTRDLPRRHREAYVVDVACLLDLDRDAAWMLCEEAGWPA
jgi:hypothetical protein